MISMMRIDDRLIHGQVAVVWSKYLGVNRIIVANDEVVKDEMQMMALKMAVPSNIKVSIKNVASAIEVLNDPRCEKLKIFVVVSNPKDALTIQQEVKELNLINVGNYGRVKQGDSMLEKKQIDKNVFADEEDMKYFKLLAETNCKVNVQVVPTDAEKTLKSIL